jgi:hypothetical protein
MRTAPRKAGLFFHHFSRQLRVIYLPMPEPGPVGVNVDPLGEPLGASVFPDGLVLLGPTRPEFAEPVDVPAVPPVVFPLDDEPVVVPPVTEPPAEPPPAVPPLLCAIANVLVSASAPANAIVVIRMVFSLVGGEDKPRKKTCVPPASRHWITIRSD